jgi:acetyl esterase
VITAGFDPLRDEGDAYAARLAEAGVPVEHDRFDAATHSFFAFSAVTPLADEAMTRAAEILARAMMLDRA